MKTSGDRRETMKIYDGHNRLLRPTDDGVWVGATFLYYPPMTRALGMPRVELVEPLRVQLAFGETPAAGEWELTRIRWRFAGSPAAVEGVRR